MDKESLLKSIEEDESRIHKLSAKLRDIIFLNDCYDPMAVINVANDIKLISEIIAIKANKLISLRN